MNTYNDRQCNCRTDRSSNRSSNVAENLRRRYNSGTTTTIETTDCPTIATGRCTHAEGHLTRAIGDYSHAQGIESAAHGVASYAKGHRTQALSDYSLTEGDQTIACGIASHAEGGLSKTEADYAHSEGLTNESRGTASHTEGIRTDADGIASHAEGFGTEADGHVSHAEGLASEAEGNVSHAQGLATRATGLASHAQGIVTRAQGKGSSTSNLATIANNDYQTVIGKYNRASRRLNNGKQTDDAFIIGNGRPCARSNAFRVTFDGKVHTDQGGYFATPGTGYSEFFEWHDRNNRPTDPVGYFVTLEGDKIKLATDRDKDDFVLGVVTGTPSLVGNAFENGQSNSYATDNFGRIRTSLTPVSDLVETNTQVRQGIREAELDLSQRVGNPLLSNQVSTAISEALTSTDEGTCMTDMPTLVSTCTPTDQNCTQDDSTQWATVTLVGTVPVRDDGRSRVGEYVVPNKEGIARPARRGGRSGFRQSSRNDSDSSNQGLNSRQTRNTSDSGFRDSDVSCEWDDGWNQDSSNSFEKDEEGYRVLRRIDQNTILILFR